MELKLTTRRSRVAWSIDWSSQVCPPTPFFVFLDYNHLLFPPESKPNHEKEIKFMINIAQLPNLSKYLFVSSFNYSAITTWLMPSWAGTFKNIILVFLVAIKIKMSLCANICNYTYISLSLQKNTIKSTALTRFYLTALILDSQL